MTLDEFLTELSAIFDSPVTRATKYTELSGWSSVTSLSVIMMAEEEFGLRLTPSNLIEAETAEALFDFIKEKVG